MSPSRTNLALLLMAVLSLLMHLEHFPKELIGIHVWRQTQTQSTINNFYEEDMNILNPRRNDRGNTEGIYRMEFPLMQWLVAVQYKVFGKKLIVTRIFMFLVGLFSVLGMYKLLEALFGNRLLSVLGAWAFNFSPSFYYYTINPLPDNLALCFSIWGLAVFFEWIKQRRDSQLWLSGLLLSLGALCKLPFIIYFVVLLGYFLTQSIQHGFQKAHLTGLLKSTAFSVLPLAWYVSVIPQWHGNIIVKGVLNSKVPFETILGYYQHNLFSTLPELLVGYGALPFFVAGFYFLAKNKAYRNPKFLLLLSLAVMATVYYLFEANAIERSHDYYLFPFYPLLFILVGYGAYHLFQKSRIVVFLFVLIIPVACFLRMKDRWDPATPGFSKDLLVYQTELRNAVPNDALVVAGNDISHHIFFYYIDKKGWGFHDDQLDAEGLRSMIANGAQYLYTDTDLPTKNPEMATFLDELLLEKGSIRVYRLKK